LNLRDRSEIRFIIMLVALFLVAGLIAYHRDRVGPGGTHSTGPGFVPGGSVPAPRIGR
jgi:hypothetical protein